MLYPETKAGAAQAIGMNRAVGNNVADTASTTSKKSFVSDTADKMQIAPRTIRRKIQVAKNLTQEVKAIVKEHGISEKGSEKLARIKEPEKQKEAAEKLPQRHHKDTTKLPQQRKNNGRTTGHQKYSKVTAKNVTYTLQTRYKNSTKLAQK